MYIGVYSYKIILKFIKIRRSENKQSGVRLFWLETKLFFICLLFDVNRVKKLIIFTTTWRWDLQVIHWSNEILNHAFAVFNEIRWDLKFDK